MTPPKVVEPLVTVSVCPPSATVPEPETVVIVAPVVPEMSNIAPAATFTPLEFAIEPGLAKASVPAVTVVAPV